MRQPSPRCGFPIVIVIYHKQRYHNQFPHRAHQHLSERTSDDQLLPRLPSLLLILYDPISMYHRMRRFRNLFIAQQVMNNERDVQWVCDAACVSDKDGFRDGDGW